MLEEVDEDQLEEAGLNEEQRELCLNSISTTKKKRMIFDRSFEIIHLSPHLSFFLSLLELKREFVKRKKLTNPQMTKYQPSWSWGGTSLKMP